MLRSKQATLRGTGRMVRAIAASTLTIALVGCDSLLDVEPQPHTVPAEELEKPTSLQARMIGAEANFFLAYDMAIVFGGLFADELADPGNSIDQRRVTPDNGLIGSADENPEGIDGLWTPMQRAAFTSNATQEALLDGLVPDAAESAELARMSLFAGYSKLMLGELFCTTAFNGVGPEFSSQETYQLAADEFTRAIDAANAETDVLYAAYVGRARARLQLGDLDGAVQDATMVPADWEYLAAVYSNNSQLEENDIWGMLTDSQRYTVAPAFRGLTVDATGVDDVRVGVFQDPEDQFGIDGSTPLFQAGKYQSATSPVRLASGHEAQYIIAEVEAAQGDPQEAVRIINEIRASFGIDAEFASSDQDEILGKLLDERGRTLFLEGQRMGDLRRYRERYAIDEFPTGEGFEDDVCMPLPNAERDNNPGI